MWKKAVPIDLRWLIGAAGWMLPWEEREEWECEWLAELWHEGRNPRRERLRLRRATLGAFVDAWALLKRLGVRKRCAEALAAPATAALLCVAGTLIIALATGGFSGIRSLLDASLDERIVAVRQRIPFMGGAARIAKDQADYWARRSDLIEAAVVWSGGRAARIGPGAGAREFLGNRMGAAEVTSESLPSHAGLIARLRPGVSVRDVERELALTAKLKKGWGEPEVVLLSDIRRGPVGGVGVALFGLFVLSTIARSSPERRVWALKLLRSSASFLLIALAWLEFVGRAPLTENTAMPAFFVFTGYVLPLAAALWTAWWLRRDSLSRCRVCFRKLAMQVYVGSVGSVLLDPGGIEHLCREWHE